MSKITTHLPVADILPEAALKVSRPRTVGVTLDVHGAARFKLDTKALVPLPQRRVARRARLPGWRRRPRRRSVFQHFARGRTRNAARAVGTLRSGRCLLPEWHNGVPVDGVEETQLTEKET